jgi:hypothetical protein
LDYDELDPNGLDIFGNFINDNDGNYAIIIWWQN